MKITIIGFVLALVSTTVSTSLRAQAENEDLILRIDELERKHEELESENEELKKQLFTLQVQGKEGEKSALEMFDNVPSFGMFHDNYFITGVPTNKPINRATADAKFQISIRQRITKSVLPFKIYSFVTYTQKSFWNVYGNSSPFKDNNYNPGISLGKALVLQNKLKGLFLLSLEHESNGRDSIQSRSWNYLTATFHYIFSPRFSSELRIWAGKVDKVGNPDLLEYKGHGLVAISYRDLNERLLISAVINPRKKIGNFNTILEVSYKLRMKFNPYVFIQHYNGYAENLLNYNEFRSMIRVGISMKPHISHY